jgi:predicted dehydrogenase
MKMPGFEIYAVGSLTEGKAEEFANKYHATKAYDNYEDLVLDPGVQLIYISTPHSLHAQHAKLALRANKPCLVEKPFSYNRETAEEVFKLAEEKKLFCGEALWSVYNPMYNLVKDMIVHNVIGRVSNITANFGYDIKDKERIINPELAGGALLDIGIYPLALIIYLLGNKPEHILSSCTRFSSGMDSMENIIFLYPGGVTANAFVSANYATTRDAFIYGDKGYIKITELSCPVSVDIYSNANELIKHFDPVPDQKTGYEFEFASAKQAIISKQTAPIEMPHEASLALLTHMDNLRKTWKIKYPFE